MRNVIILSLSLVISAAPLALAQTSGSSATGSSTSGSSASAGSTSGSSATGGSTSAGSAAGSTSAGSASGSSVSGGSASAGSATGSATSTRTIAAIVTADPQFSTLLKALKAAGLDKTLAGTGPFTVFAPTNAAFNKLPSGELTKLLGNKAALTKLLQAHVVKGKLTAKGVLAAKSVAALSGDKLSVSGSGSSVKVDNASVTKADLAASNGVIHVVDAVIMPKGMGMGGGSMGGSSTGGAGATGSSASGSGATGSSSGSSTGASGGSTSGGSTSGGSTSGSSTR